MKARPYEASDRPRWNELVRGGRSGHFMLEREYMEYHSDRFEDASMVIEDDAGKVVGVLPASRHGDELVSHGGLTFGGLQLPARVGARKTLEVLRAVIEHGMASGATNLRYKPVPHIYHRVPGEEDLYALFRAGATLARRDISATIALDEPIGYSKGRKHSIKQAPANVRVEESTDFAAFMAIEAEALERHGATATHTAEELTLLAARFPKSIRLFLGMLDDEPLAGVVVYDSPTVRHTQYIGSGARGKELGIGEVVVDHLIRDAVGSFRWFDFGISTEQAGRWLNEGLMSSKEAYGARGTLYDHYDVPLHDGALAGLS